MAFDIRETAFKLPENWKLVRLGDIAKVNEKSLTKKSQPDFIRYIDISSVSTGAFDTPKLLKKDEIPSRAKRILRNNDFIISTVRPNLKQFSFIEEAQENLIASTGFCVISSNNSKLAWYLYSLITSDLFTEYLVKIADGGAYPAFNPKEIEDAIIPLPDKDNLKFISDTSRFFHKKIQLNTQINQTLEQIAQALFKSWFVDFDPVRAKVQALSDGLSLEQAELAVMQTISGKTPEELTALSQTQPDRYAELAETAKAFPCEFGGDGVPMGWNISIIGQEVETVGGATPSTKEEKFWNNGEIAWTTPKDLSSATSPVLLKTERKITESGLKKISSGLLSIGTVLLSSRAPVGYLSLAQIPVAINQGYIAIKCNKSLNNYYMLQWCKENLEEIKGRASGTTFLEISKTTFRQIPIIVPDGNILSLFEKQCSSIYQSITVNTKENIYLEKTRDLLLPRLLNGEI